MAGLSTGGSLHVRTQNTLHFRVAAQQHRQIRSHRELFKAITEPWDDLLAHPLTVPVILADQRLGKAIQRISHAAPLGHCLSTLSPFTCGGCESSHEQLWGQTVPQSAGLTSYDNPPLVSSEQ